jgi:MOSC domain-containing protein YiiM
MMTDPRVNKMADPAAILRGVYTGKTEVLKEEGHRSAIVKSLTRERLTLTKLGLKSDEQADRGAHGGLDRALHQYPPQHYKVWQAEFPGDAHKFEPGTFGENISTSGWSEESVCIGDVFKIGTAIVAVSQPRIPCSKLNHRFGIPTLVKRVHDTGLTGWFFRVLEPGNIQLGDPYSRVRRDPLNLTLKMVWDVYRVPRPDLDASRAVRDHPALAATWKRLLDCRLDRLARKPIA